MLVLFSNMYRACVLFEHVSSEIIVETIYAIWYDMT